MDQGTLVSEQIDAGAKLVADFGHYKPLRAAFWIKDPDDREWYLCLASDQINDTNFDLAYGEVNRLVRPMSNLWLDPFQVKVMGADHPMAKAVIELTEKYPGICPIRLRSRRLGNITVDDAFVYPVPTAVGV